MTNPKCFVKKNSYVGNIHCFENHCMEFCFKCLWVSNILKFIWYKSDKSDILYPTLKNIFLVLFSANFFFLKNSSHALASTQKQKIPYFDLPHQTSCITSPTITYLIARPDATKKLDPRVFLVQNCFWLFSWRAWSFFWDCFLWMNN